MKKESPAKPCLVGAQAVEAIPLPKEMANLTEAILAPSAEDSEFDGCYSNDDEGKDPLRDVPDFAPGDFSAAVSKRGSSRSVSAVRMQSTPLSFEDFGIAIELYEMSLKSPNSKIEAKKKALQRGRMSARMTLKRNMLLNISDSRKIQLLEEVRMSLQRRRENESQKVFMPFASLPHCSFTTFFSLTSLIHFLEFPEVERSFCGYQAAGSGERKRKQQGPKRFVDGFSRALWSGRITCALSVAESDSDG